MSDVQLRKRLRIRKILIASVLVFLVAIGLTYYTYQSETTWQTYLSEKSQESSLASQVNSLQVANQDLLNVIEDNGKQLVSFSEDKIRYIDLASTISAKHNVRINKLSVSDVWQEGEMSGMTASIEVEGAFEGVCDFVDEYCGTKYTNRINIVSCRPTGRYAWLTRTIDGMKVLGWFDTTMDEQMFEQQTKRMEAERRAALQAAGLPVENETDDIPMNYVPIYNPETGQIVDYATGKILTQEELDEMPISLDTMFSDKPYKVYLVVDFLGRT